MEELDISLSTRPELAKNVSLDQIVGHRSQLNQLRLLLSSKRIPHALLFTGPDSVGKRTVAHAFAAALLAADLHLTKGSEEMTIEHSNCLVQSGNHPDLLIVTPEKEGHEIHVDVIRQLIGSLSLKPYSSKHIVAVINEAEKMNLSACNSLLKTLEEPNASCIIILVSSAAHRLPQTIVSRCQPIFFGALNQAAVEELLERIMRLLELNEASEANKLKNQLCAFAGDSLAALQISSFINPRTLTIEPKTRCREHLLATSTKYNEVKSLIERMVFLERNNAPTASYPVHLAAELAKDDLAPHFWSALIQTLREKLEGVDPSSRPLWAKLLEDCCHTTRLIQERNLNPQLQLTTLFVDIFRQAARGLL